MAATSPQSLLEQQLLNVPGGSPGQTQSSWDEAREAAADAAAASSEASAETSASIAMGLADPAAVSDEVAGEEPSFTADASESLPPEEENEPSFDINLRRPVYGLLGRRYRPAQLEIVLMGGDGKTRVDLINSSYARGFGPGTANFILQHVGLMQASGVGVEQTFGGTTLRGSSSRPPDSLQVQGLLFDSESFPWLTEWVENYNRYVSAEQCIMRNAVAYLTVAGRLYVGYVLGSEALIVATGGAHAAQISFSMVLKSTRPVSDSSASGHNRLQDYRLSLVAPSAMEGNKVNSLVDIYRRNLLDGDTTAAAAETSAQAAVSAEMSRGSYGDIPAASGAITLSDPGSRSDAIFEVHLEQLLRVATLQNRAAGREIHSLAGVRRQYMADMEAALASVGEPSPFSSTGARERARRLAEGTPSSREGDRAREWVQEVMGSSVEVRGGADTPSFWGAR